jgi:hypothetical protein
MGLSETFVIKRSRRCASRVVKYHGVAGRRSEALLDIAAAHASDARMAAPALLTHPHVQQALRWLFAGVIGRICFVRGRASNSGPDRITDFRTDYRIAPRASFRVIRLREALLG